MRAIRRWLQVKASEFKRSERGAVSLFFIILLAAIFLFQSIFIDYARLEAVEYETERAVKAALRSVYAGFDQDLVTYGLYGVANQDEAESVMENIINDHIEPPSISLFSTPEVEEIQVDHVYQLADHRVFKQQILEEMKYTAPVEFMTELWDKWNKTGMDDKMQEASMLSKQAESLEQQIEEREKALDDAWEKAERLFGPHGLIPTYGMDYKARLLSIQKLAEKIGIYDISMINHKIDELTESIDQQKRKRDKLRDSAYDSEGNPKPSVIEQIEEINDRISSLRSEKRTFEDLALTYAEYVKEVGEAQLLLIEHKREAESALDSLIASLDEAEAAEKKLEEEMEKVDHEMTSGVIIYDSSFYQLYQTDASKAVSYFETFEQKFKPMKFVTGIDYVEVHENLMTLSDKMISGSSTIYSTWLSIEHERQARKEKIEQQKEKEKERIKEVLDQLTASLFSCPGKERTQYLRLMGDGINEGLVNKYLTFNDEQADEVEEARQLDDPETVGKDAMNLIDGIHTALLSARDEAYINEYALSKFNYRTQISPGVPLNGASASHVSYALSKPHEHPLLKQEAEYILYGLPTCEANHSAAFSEMYLTRLAVHTAEELMKPTKAVTMLGSPLLVFLSAVAEAALQAWNDMKDLVNGKDVPLSDLWAKGITLNYKDYLRIFYFLHSNDRNMMARMQALIELNTGKDLTKLAVYTKAKVSFSLKRAFIPGTPFQIQHEVVYAY